jgi:hypothetical protein
MWNIWYEYVTEDEYVAAEIEKTHEVFMFGFDGFGSNFAVYFLNYDPIKDNSRNIERKKVDISSYIRYIYYHQNIVNY